MFFTDVIPFVKDAKDEIIIYGFAVMIFLVSAIISIFRYDTRLGHQRSIIRNKIFDHDQINQEFNSSIVKL